MLDSRVVSCVELGCVDVPVEADDSWLSVDSWLEAPDSWWAPVASSDGVVCVEVVCVGVVCSASGARSGALTESGEPAVDEEEDEEDEDEDDEDKDEDEEAGSPARAARALVVVLLPGNALAAASANTPVRTTLPAISQRLARCSRRRAASRAWKRGDM